MAEEELRVAEELDAQGQKDGEGDDSCQEEAADSAVETQ